MTADPDRRRNRRLIVVGLLVTAVVAIVVSQLASSQPDGLQYVAEQTGFADSATGHAAASSPLAGYAADVTDDHRLNRAVAGLVGVALTLAVGYGVFWLARRRPHDHGASPQA